jgi:hypothetical protein
LNYGNISDSNLIYPDDLFYIYVRSQSIAPALYYVQRERGYASIFSSYTIGAGNYTFNISNNDGTFGKIILIINIQQSSFIFLRFYGNK